MCSYLIEGRCVCVASLFVFQLEKFPVTVKKLLQVFGIVEIVILTEF